MTKISTNMKSRGLVSVTVLPLLSSAYLHGRTPRSTTNVNPLHPPFPATGGLLITGTSTCQMRQANPIPSRIDWHGVSIQHQGPKASAGGRR